MSIRAFIALELPESLRAGLGQVQEKLRPSGRDVKWVRPEGIHLTLKFLGNVEESQIEEIARLMAQAASGCPRLTLLAKGAGAFPGLTRPRVVWIGLTGDCIVPLKALAKRLEDALIPLGFEPEGRPFSPHLTLGRAKGMPTRGGPGGKSQKLSEAILGLSGVEVGEFEAAELVLYRSELKPGGAVYTKLRSVMLGD